MVTLIDLAGLPISINLEKESLIYDVTNVNCNCAKHVSLGELSPSLLNKAISYPKVVYQHHYNVVMAQDVSRWPSDLKYDVIFIPAGLLGIEYNKTHIFYTPATIGKIASVIHVINGVLTVFLQKNRPKIDKFQLETHVEDAKLINVNAGEKLAIPTGYYYTFINSEIEPVVFALITSTSDQTIDYKSLFKENGLAYYLIAKNARREIVANPRYRSHVDVGQVNAHEINERMSYRPTEEVSLYEEVLDAAKTLQNMLLANL